MTQFLTEEMIFSLLPPRLPESHKGSYGKALLVCGSARYRGAARLAAEGAARMGAGLVTLATTEAVLSCVLPAVPEVICLPLQAESSGTIAAGNLPLLANAAGSADVLLFGCGVGQSADTAKLLSGLLRQTGCPLLLDADGLNLLAESEWNTLHRPAVLTPHPGEMARLLGCSQAEVLSDPAAFALACAAKYDCVAVLKTHQTLIAAPTGELWQNTTGNAGLARGGSGDLLSGMIAGLLAQGCTPLAAACCGVYLHGAAADRCIRRRGMQTMLPHDLLEDLGNLFAEKGR